MNALPNKSRWLPGGVAVFSLLGGIFMSTGVALAADGSVRAGLWEFSSKGSMRGLLAGQMKQMEAELAKMPPGQQAQFRAMFEQQMNQQMDARTECITPEQARLGLKHLVEDIRDDQQCKQDVKWHGANKVDVRMTCPDGDVSDWKIEVVSAQQVESTVTVTPPAGSGGQPSTMTWSGRWKQASCP